HDAARFLDPGQTVMLVVVVRALRPVRLERLPQPASWVVRVGNRVPRVVSRARDASALAVIERDPLRAGVDAHPRPSRVARTAENLSVGFPNARDAAVPAGRTARAEGEDRAVALPHHPVRAGP